MTIFDGYFPMGLGTSRFPIAGPTDTVGIERAIRLVHQALAAGINYIDTSNIYSAGMAHRVLKEVFQDISMPFSVTIKSLYEAEPTADDVRASTEQQLSAMGLERAKMFVCWTIKEYAEYEKIMQKGSVYDGALRLQAEGLIEHICFSAHAPAEDIIKMIQGGAFAGVTISYSALNAIQMQPVLEAAQRYHVGVAVMNPLGGGIIAQNKDQFSYLCAEDDINIVQAALKFVNAHPAVGIVLSGVSSEAELMENLAAFTEPGLETAEKRYHRVVKSTGTLVKMCTGCGYCDGCPKGIPLSYIMQRRNSLHFKPTAMYNRTEPSLLKNINLFYTQTNSWIPETPQNPCIRCGQCEMRCTQGLKIMDGVADMYRRAGEVGYSQSARKKRLGELLYGQGYQRVGLFPNGGIARLLMQRYHKYFGEPEFEWVQFNSNPALWGEKDGGMTIFSPQDIDQINPDIIVICTYKYEREIHDTLRQNEHCGMKVVRLHQKNDVPWIF